MRVSMSIQEFDSGDSGEAAVSRTGADSVNSSRVFQQLPQLLTWDANGPSSSSSRGDVKSRFSSSRDGHCPMNSPGRLSFRVGIHAVVPPWAFPIQSVQLFLKGFLDGPLYLVNLGHR